MVHNDGPELTSEGNAGCSALLKIRLDVCIYDPGWPNLSRI